MIYPVEHMQAAIPSPIEVVIGGECDTQRSAILVTGAESPVGRAVVAQLLSQGRRVRALLPDKSAADGLTRDLPKVNGISTGPHARLELAYVRGMFALTRTGATGAHFLLSYSMLHACQLAAGQVSLAYEPQCSACLRLLARGPWVRVSSCYSVCCMPDKLAYA